MRRSTKTGYGMISQAFFEQVAVDGLSGYGALPSGDGTRLPGYAGRFFANPSARADR